MKREKRERLYMKDGRLVVAVYIPDPERPGKTKRKRIATGLAAGQEDEARALLEQMQNQVDAKKEAGDDFDGTVSGMCRLFVNRRKAFVLTWNDDEQRLRDYVECHVLADGRKLGALMVREVRTRHVVDLFENLRGRVKRGEVAPKTVRNVYGVLKALFRDALKRDLITHNPCNLSREDLPPNIDRDPNWRAGAIFTRRELKMLVTDKRIPEVRRVVYALESLGAMRFGEFVPLTFNKLRFNLKPLGKIQITEALKSDNTVGTTKTNRPREMPMHRALARILKDWKHEGWERAMGRPPSGDDLIVPVVPESSVANHGRGRRLTPGTMQTSSYYLKRFAGDLEMLGLRHRRGHDLRSTMPTMAQEAGASKDILECCTHTPSRNQGIKSYMKFSWAARCEAVSAFKFVLPKSPRPELQVVALAAGAEESCPGVVPPEEKAEEKQMDTTWRRRESNPSLESSDRSPTGHHIAPSGRHPSRVGSDTPPLRILKGSTGTDSRDNGTNLANDLNVLLVRTQELAASHYMTAMVERLRAILPRMEPNSRARHCVELALDALTLPRVGSQQNPRRLVQFLVESAIRCLGESAPLS